ncbi:hypothetical protein RvY_05366 [Ramazzottius varieornatus]|uniref:Uncharacterized protein n=1 Tax=Ramazzottius varieornatus TaxID=947166 RepID=A0A1D1UVE1_RAMVA|nr:hypothetical protein RvY_05366 [Ramazzottius varieornatus]
MELVPPTTRPADMRFCYIMKQPDKPAPLHFWGTVVKFQSRKVAWGSAIWTSGNVWEKDSGGPASNSKIFQCLCSARRLATTLPAVPAPTANTRKMFSGMQFSMETRFGDLRNKLDRFSNGRLCGVVWSKRASLDKGVMQFVRVHGIHSNLPMIKSYSFVAFPGIVVRNWAAGVVGAFSCVVQY